MRNDCTNLIVFLHRVPPNPLFIVFKEFRFQRLLTDWTRNRLRLVSWWNYDELGTQLSLTLSGFSGSRRLRIHIGTICAVLAFTVICPVMNPILFTELRIEI